jgi:hypothetical protein
MKTAGPALHSRSVELGLVMKRAKPIVAHFLDVFEQYPPTLDRDLEPISQFIWRPILTQNHFSKLIQLMQ